MEPTEIPVSKRYVGTLQLLARPLTLGAYNELRGWDIPKDEDPTSLGYMVEYDDGHPTWLPADVFESTYRVLTTEEKDLHDALKEAAADLERLYGEVKPGRYNALAMTALEQSIMWIVKELTS